MRIYFMGMRGTLIISYVSFFLYTTILANKLPGHAIIGRACVGLLDGRSGYAEAHSERTLLFAHPGRWDAHDESTQDESLEDRETAAPRQDREEPPPRAGRTEGREA